MKSIPPIAIVAFAALLTGHGPAFAASAVEGRLQAYQAEGAGPFSAEAGAAMWQQAFQPKPGVAERSCASCHGSDLTAAGRHKRTGKPIDALAPSANPQRLSDAGKIEKWFRRNCKWTIGRECTPQEKGDFLRFIQSQ
jgi:hypothetical protein